MVVIRLYVKSDRTRVRLPPAPLVKVIDRCYNQGMRIASINFYMGNKQPKKDISFIKHLNLDAFGLQEGWRHVELIDKELPSHKVYWGKSNTRAAREVGVGLNVKRNEFLGYGAKEVSDVERGEETKIFKSRYTTTVRFKRDNKKYAIINYHGNAVVQSKRTGKLLRHLERVREWLEASVWIESKIKRLQDKGYDVFVTGDWNYRRMKVKGFRLDYYSPQRIFNRNKLSYVERGLDYVAYPERFKRKKVQIIGTDETGSDHPWLVVEVEGKNG